MTSVTDGMSLPSLNPKLKSKIKPDVFLLYKPGKFPALYNYTLKDYLLFNLPRNIFISENAYTTCLSILKYMKIKIGLKELMSHFQKNSMREFYEST